jgi:cobalt-zinc-cadmium efflux system outer membrane protein
MVLRNLLRGCGAAFLIAASLQVAAQTMVSPLGLAVDAAWQRSPEGRALMARRNEIAAERKAAQAWTPGVPTLGIAERNDRLTGHNGVRETEISLSAPVWLPGQRSARQALAESGREELDGQIAQSRLSIAGSVRDQYWAMAAAREALDEARDHEHHLVALTQEVTRRVRAGDLARTDGMLAQQEVLAAQAAISATQARLNEAVSRFSVLTGRSNLFEQKVETIASTTATHPRLLAAEATLRRAQASLQAVRSSRRDAPTVGVSIRRERDRDIPGSTNTVGVAVQIPFGTAARNEPVEAAAMTQVEAAQAELAQAERAVQADIALADQQLQEATRALDAAAARTKLTAEHVRLIDKAFRLGERGLADLIRARSLAHEAEAAERHQRVAIGLAHAKVNQAKGILP